MDQMIFGLQPVNEMKGLHGPFYVIENYPYPQFLTDEEGELKSFDNYESAFTEAMDCQDGYIISFHPGSLITDSKPSQTAFSNLKPVKGQTEITANPFFE